MTDSEQMCSGLSQHKLISKEICLNAFFKMPIAASCRLCAAACRGGWLPAANLQCQVSACTKRGSPRGGRLCWGRSSAAAAARLQKRLSSSAFSALLRSAIEGNSFFPLSFIMKRAT